MTPDEFLGSQEESPQLRTQLLEADPEGGSPTLVIQGTRTSLRFLGELLMKIAEVDTLPYDVHLDPRGPGQFHLDQASSVGLYIECIDS
jgi:hypothetical protein